MPKRKRGPPLSYEQKYRQIKKSGFLVDDIGPPTTPSAKGMITRYHRYLFGKSGKAGLTRRYKPYRGKYQEDVAQQFKKPKGAKRISTVIPKGRKIGNVTKSYIDVDTTFGITERRYKLQRKAMATNPDKEIRRVLTPVRGKNFRIYIGRSILPNEYKDIRDAITAYHEARKKYADRKEQIGVMSIEYKYSRQRSPQQYRRRRGK